MQILRIDVASYEFTRQPVPDAWDQLGGCGLISKIRLAEIPPTCEPLSFAQQTDFFSRVAGGMLGTLLRPPVRGRKKVLSQGEIKGSNSGGSIPAILVRLGLRRC
jgi:aldehyde:ferredoxin oxidoreductase